MDVSQLPFNRLIGLESLSPGDECLVSLAGEEKYTNHLGTVHGSALMAVAEAGSGAFLLQRLGGAEAFIPVVRRFEAKFRRPASGRVSARCAVGDEEIAEWRRRLDSAGRLSAAVPVEVVDASGTVVMSALVEWFITRDKSGT